MSKPAFPIAGPYPRLSDELPLDHPRECHQCGTGDDLSVWQEHSTDDQPEDFYIVLCGLCAGVIIDAHPRLYRQMEPNEPAPGAMPICLNCRWRGGMKCLHPQSRLRGGRGLRLEFPSPTMFHVDHRQKGQRTGSWIKVWPGVVYACEGKELAR